MMRHECTLSGHLYMASAHSGLVILGQAIAAAGQTQSNRDVRHPMSKLA